MKMNIGGRIRELRKKRGLSQCELAKAAAISREGLGNYERGDRLPNVEIIARIAHALGTSVAYLSGEADNSDIIDVKMDQDTGFDLNKGLIENMKKAGYTIKDEGKMLAGFLYSFSKMDEEDKKNLFQYMGSVSEPRKRLREESDVHAVQDKHGD